MIQDRRTKREVATTQWLVVATDAFVSKLICARSLYAIPCSTEAEIDVVLANMRHRTEMKRPRVVLASRYRPTLRKGDVLSIPSRNDCQRFFIKDGFK